MSEKTLARPVTVRAMTDADAAAVLSIYQEGIEGGNATFDPRAPDWETWKAGKLAAPRLIAEAGGAVVGWAALSPYSYKPFYRGVAEVSVYVARVARRAGVGATLLQRLVEASEEESIWTLEARIFPENETSLRLHARCGFTEVGVRRRIGKAEVGPHAGRWRDVVLMERRSAQVGL